MQHSRVVKGRQACKIAGMETGNRTGPNPLGLYYMYAQQAAAAGTLELDIFMRGVKAYQASEQPVLNPSATYKKVANFGRGTLWQCRPKATGKPILLVPSFVNTADILDVHPQVGLVAQLAAAGYNPHILTWGVPQPEHLLTVESAIADILLPAIQQFEQPIPLLGYCVGGTVALAAAQLAPNHVSALILAATPWDFAQTPTHQNFQHILLDWQHVFTSLPVMPADVVQTGFVQMEHEASLKRICQHGEPMSETDRARLIALEDWLGNPIPLDGAIAQTLLADWHIHNQTMAGYWQVNGVTIDPKNVGVPTLVVRTLKDKLVPNTASAPLLTVPNSTDLQVNCGHVGLMAGRAAVPQFMVPTFAWLHSALADSKQTAKLAS